MNQRTEPQAELTESRKMMKQAERDEESRRLVTLMARVKRQMAALQSAPPPRAA